MFQRRFVFGLIFPLVFSAVSYASGDFGCGAPRGSILFRGYESCNSVPFLSPSNDSRLNLELLLIDSGKLKGTMIASPEYPAAPEFAWLQVPFDLESMQFQASTISATSQTSLGKSAANSNNYAEGEGSRCSHADDGLEAFKKAVSAAALPAEDAAILIASRTALAPGCN